jgi:hypothetical protein
VVEEPKGPARRFSQNHNTEATLSLDYEFSPEFDAYKQETEKAAQQSS